MKREDVVPGLLIRMEPRYQVALLLQLRAEEIRGHSKWKYNSFNGEDSGAECAKSIADALLYLEQAKVEILKKIETSKTSGGLCLCLSQIIEAEVNLCVAAESVLLIQDEVVRENERVRRDNDSASDNNPRTDKGSSKH